MKQLLHVALTLLCAISLQAQTPMKSFVSKPNENPRPFQPAEGLPSLSCNARTSDRFHPKPIHLSNTECDVLKSVDISSSGSFWMTFAENQLWSSRASINPIMARVFPSSVKDHPTEWQYVAQTSDKQNVEHVRVQQLYAGYPIHKQEMILHLQNGGLRDLNGFAWTGPVPKQISQPQSAEAVMQATIEYLQGQGVKFQDHPQFHGLFSEEDEMHLCWIPREGKLVLSYEMIMHPNALDHWKVYINAVSLEVIEAYSQLCALYPHQLYNKEEYSRPHLGNNSHIIKHTATTLTTPTSAVVDGATTTTDGDLLGQSRVVNGYIVGTNYYMVDASRTGMFDPQQSSMPNEPFGAIWTIDGQNGSPQSQDFEVFHVSNTTNNWAPLEVSAHFNAGQSYEYFLQKFNRNSLNGDGGNIISIINIADENGDGLDNAFWSGTAMFYGNGDVSFKPLAQGLDVAGHEMSHGVIQNTANLEYLGQSGALNESYADVFGAMIDRNDWQLGEDVVVLSQFPSGALRDLSNPHNGGNGPQDNGWQPQHMNEYQNLPNTPEGDNGGVHVNSGIPNRAFFLFASSVGKEKAEQVYYKALRDYLVMSSQFIDMRNAVEKAATDLHGANSAEVTAARSAFDGVGIGAGAGNDHQDDIETNPGADFILATDVQESDLYWVPPSNPNQFIKLNVPAPLSVPSFTDDGSTAVYVDVDNEMILLNFNWSQGLDFEAFYLEDNPQGIWRNVVVSKDGEKVAYTTSQLTNEIGVFDYPSQSSGQFLLYNPTSAEGIFTGDVLYADIMEFDYSGEYIMYDALNRIESSFGDGIEYWDISFLNVWNNDAQDYADGFINKLFTTLPENVSVGNPSLAKNSPYIITFDYIEDYFDNFGTLQTDYRILAANIEAGIVNEIFQNTTVGYPSYSGEDDQILFTYDDFGDLLLVTIDVQPGDKTLPVVGTDELLIDGAQKGVWFQTGTRVISGIHDVDENSITLYPQPAKDVVHITLEEGTEDMILFKMTDMSGRDITQGRINERTIDIRQLPSGIYMLELIGESTSVRELFVKE